MRRIVALAFLIGVALLPAGGRSRRPRRSPFSSRATCRSSSSIRPNDSVPYASTASLPTRTCSAGRGRCGRRSPARLRRRRRPPSRSPLVSRDRGRRCRAVLRDCRGSARIRSGRLRQGVSDEVRIDLQYWIWYPYNDYSSTFPPGDVWQVHEGDWESVSVILDLSGRPIVVGLSKHCEARAAAGRESVGRDYVPSSTSVSARTPTTSGRARSATVRSAGRGSCATSSVRSSSTIAPAPAGRCVPARTGRGEPSDVDALRGDVGRDGYVHFANNDPVAYPGSPRAPAFPGRGARPSGKKLGWPRG